jgi:hypothetical protein
VIGFVSRSSIVPDFFSSAKERIVIAGIKKRRTKGANINNPSILAYPLSRMLNSNGKTHKNNPLINKKTVTII